MNGHNIISEGDNHEALKSPLDIDVELLRSLSMKTFMKQHQTTILGFCYFFGFFFARQVIVIVDKPKIDAKSTLCVIKTQRHLHHHPSSQRSIFLTTHPPLVPFCLNCQTTLDIQNLRPSPTNQI